MLWSWSYGDHSLGWTIQRGFASVYTSGSSFRLRIVTYAPGVGPGSIISHSIMPDGILGFNYYDSNVPGIMRTQILVVAYWPFVLLTGIPPLLWLSIRRGRRAPLYDTAPSHVDEGSLVLSYAPRPSFATNRWFKRVPWRAAGILLVGVVGLAFEIGATYGAVADNAADHDQSAITAALIGAQILAVAACLAWIVYRPTRVLKTA